MSIEWQDIDYPGKFHSHSQTPMRVDGCKASHKKINSDVVKVGVEVKVNA